MSASTASPMHDVRISFETLADISTALEHAIMYSDGGSEQNEIDLVNWRRAEGEIDALLAEVRAQGRIDKLARALTRLLLKLEDSKVEAVKALQDVTGKTVTPAV